VNAPLVTYVLRHGDRALVLSQRLLEAVTHAPEIEEDMALANLALDLLGQTRALYSYAAKLGGHGDEDQLAYFRDPISATRTSSSTRCWSSSPTATSPI
jgi:ring-1,2-phenylacetyl-CoA epoxidase subunit PaaC